MKIIVDINKHKQNEYPSPAIFPNPSTGKFTLRYTGSKEIFYLNVYDLMGKNISSQKIDFSRDQEIELDIKEKGLYLVSLSNENSQITKKVIVE